MKTKVELNIKPFTVPNFAVYDGFRAGSGQVDSIPLAALPEEVLADLCREFVTAVFKKAGKKNPPQFIVQGD